MIDKKKLIEEIENTGFFIAGLRSGKEMVEIAKLSHGNRYLLHTMQSEVGRMLKRLMNRTPINNKLNSYPCSDYLHNALRFIEKGEADVAYDEICHAIIRSGGRLTESEEEYRKKVE